MSRIDKIDAIATFFKVSTDYLLGKTNAPNVTILSSVPDSAAPIDGLSGYLQPKN